MTRRDARHTPDKVSLKIVAGELVDAVGGSTKAHGYCRADQRRISDYASAHTDTFMPVDVAFDLERRAIGSAGFPQITRELARQHGFALVPEHHDGAPDALGIACGASKCAAALIEAAPGGIDKAEAARLLPLLEDQDRTVSAMISHCRRVLAGDD